MKGGEILLNDDDLRKFAGNKIKYFREQKNITQDELAEEFKENCKPTPWFNKNYKYKIWEQYTTELYHKWQSIVQSIYIKEYLKEVK